MRITNSNLFGGAEQVRVKWNISTSYVVFQFHDFLEYNSVIVDIRQFTANCDRLLHVESLQPKRKLATRKVPYIFGKNTRLNDF